MHEHKQTDANLEHLLINCDFILDDLDMQRRGEYLGGMGQEAVKTSMVSGCGNRSGLAYLLDIGIQCLVCLLTHWVKYAARLCITEICALSSALGHPLIGTGFPL